ncbi:MAG: hypothetical protein WA667_27940, partial [Candidatus Nitrosopolaris sp.]
VILLASVVDYCDTTCFGGGLLPPRFTHCNTAVPPFESINTRDSVRQSSCFETDCKAAVGFFVVVVVRDL